jgi:hypothetical protein
MIGSAMQLPFTQDEFLDLFAVYNGTVWPALVALWFASVVAGGWLLSGRPPSGRWMSALLATHWAWSGLAYHAAFFTRINPAAWLFAVLFAIQAGAFLWLGVAQGRLSFVRRPHAWAPAAWGLIAYSLLYPALNALQHLELWRIPAFGVPCPTTIFTAGVLMLARPHSWQLSLIPMIWAAIGGSAALLLGVRADYALPVAGIALAACTWRRTG